MQRAYLAGVAFFFLLCGQSLGADEKVLLSESFGAEFPVGWESTGGTLLTKDSMGLSDHALAAIGGYSTFSTWMLETERLEEEHQLRGAFANIAVSMLLGLMGALLGQWIVAATLGHPIGERL